MNGSRDKESPRAQPRLFLVFTRQDVVRHVLALYGHGTLCQDVVCTIGQIKMLDLVRFAGSESHNITVVVR